jgi:hypothetical protein
MRREGREELELLGPKMDRRPVDPQPVPTGSPPFGELPRIDGLRQRIVEPAPECRDPLRDRLCRAEVDRPQSVMSAASLLAHEPQVLGAGRRLGHDRDPRAIACQQAAERVGVGDRSHPGARGRQPLELRRRPAFCARGQTPRTAHWRRPSSCRMDSGRLPGGSGVLLRRNDHLKGAASLESRPDPPTNG